MAVDVTLENVSSGYSLSKINSNFEAIETALADCLSRSGVTPNTLSADIDANSNTVTNLGTPSNNSDAATKEYVDDNVGDAPTHAAAAAASAAAALASENASATSETNAQTSEDAAALDAIDAAASAQEAVDAVAALGSVVVLKGGWDASAGTFPGAGSAETGWSYQVTVAGTVDSVAFSVNDRIIALTDNASTSTYATNWLIADYSDTVASVAGEVGAVSAADLRTAINVEDGADVTDATNVAAAGALILSTENQALTGGVAVTVKDLGTQSSGTHTMDVADRPHQKLVNGGAFTLAPGSVEGSCLLLVTNNGSAGAITDTGFDLVDGDDWDTTDTNKWLCQITVIGGSSILTKKALQ